MIRTPNKGLNGSTTVVNFLKRYNSTLKSPNVTSLLKTNDSNTPSSTIINPIGSIVNLMLRFYKQLITLANDFTIIFYNNLHG